MDKSEIKDLYPFQSKFHKIKSYKYHYIDEGKGDPVIMLHGNPSWSFLYRNLIAKLRETNRVIAPDHLGCGLSDKPQDFPYRLETHIDNLESLILKLNLKNITLVIHDWGGPIGLGFAVRYPKRIKRLVILNSAAFSFNLIPLRIALCKIPFIGDFLIRQLNLFCLLSVHMAVQNKLDPKIAQGFLLPYQTVKSRTAISRFVQDIPMGPEDPSYELLLEIEHGLWLLRESPICIIWGMKDWCFTPRFLKKWLAFYPDAKLLKLENAGHYLLEDCFPEASEFIREFLDNS